MTAWPIKRSITALVTVLLILLISLGGNAAWQESLIKENVTLLKEDALPGVEILPNIYGHVLEIRGEVLATSFSDPAQMKINWGKLTAAGLEAKSALKDYDKFLDAAEPQLYAATVTSMNSYLKLCAQFQDLNTKSRKKEAYELWSRSEPAAFAALHDSFKAEIDFNNGLASKFSAACDRSIRVAAIVSWTLLLLSIAAAFLLVRFVLSQIDATFASIHQINTSVSHIVRELLGASEHVAATALQVSTSSKVLSQGSSEQAASIQETSASTNQINSVTGQNADHAQEASLLMVSVVDQISGTHKSLEDLSTGMSEIANSSKQVSKVVQVIEEIAFQTNLLAVNAAVEAAHAGEAGRGFSVVAAEVRDLARRCAQAAKDTKALISESEASSSGGTRKVSQVAEAARMVATNAVKAKTLVDEVSRANIEQVSGIDQISRSLREIESVTNHTAASATETEAASRQLSGQAVRLRHMAVDLEKQVIGFVRAMQVLG